MRWSDLPLNPPVRTLRWFAVYAFGLFVALAIWRWRQEDETSALLLSAIAVAAASTGMMGAARLRPIFAAALIVTFPIGWLVSHLLLGLLFFGMFVPLGLFFRLIGRDALALRFRPEYESYWVSKHAAPDVRSYFRQS